jgi:hypothetical protein
MLGTLDNSACAFCFHATPTTPATGLHFLVPSQNASANDTLVFSLPFLYFLPHSLTNLFRPGGVSRMLSLATFSISTAFLLLGSMRPPHPMQRFPLRLFKSTRVIKCLSLHSVHWYMSLFLLFFIFKTVSLLR